MQIRKIDPSRASEECFVSNPLLDFSREPRFDAIQPEHIGPAIDSLLAQASAAVAVAETASPATWETVVIPLEDATERLWRGWGIVSHLHAVVNTPELRTAYNANLAKITRFSSELTQNLALYRQYKALRSSSKWPLYSQARRRSIELALRDFQLGGAELDAKGRARLAQIQQDISAISARFSQNVLDATDAWSCHLDSVEQLAGLAPEAIAAAQDAAAAEGRKGWKLTLQMPCYIAVMTQASNRDLREKLYRAYVVRCSDQGDDPTVDNSTLIDQLLALRAELAHLLGFPSYAAYSLAAKMAESPQHVINFLNDLALRARPYALRDRDELDQFASDHLGIAKLEAWDLAYAAEKLKQSRFGFSEQEVKQYFTLPHVLAGLFATIHSLYGVRVVADSADVWHPDVQFYRIEDDAGCCIGQFYCDLFAREGKRGGAWMDDCRQRRRTSQGVQTPIAFVVCNFGAGKNGEPATLRHDDVITLYHEMGHALHQLMTQVDELAVAGINGVEWDAVELPSQFMENFCWEWSRVQAMTCHVTSGQSLPYTLFERMRNGKNFHSGSKMLRQIEFALFDMHLHNRPDPTGESVMDVLERVRHTLAVRHPPAWSRFPHQFSHIFAGGYAAGYYSYKWAEVLSADAYAAFEENTASIRQTGQRFLEEILQQGGSRSAHENFCAFRGREPTIEALLRHNGMTG